MKEQNASEFAFASVCDRYIQTGLTKREYFAAMAMQGHISACGIEGVVVDGLARYAVECADALINELNK